MGQQDPYAAIAKPLDDPYAAMATGGTQAPPASQHPYLDAAKDFGAGILKGAGNTANNIGKLLIPDRLVSAFGATPPTQEKQDSYFKPTNTAQSIGRAVEQAGEFLIPGAAEEMGAAKLAPTIGKLAARMTTGALGSGMVNSVQGGGFIPGAIAGAAGPVIGKALKTVAPVIAEKSMGIRAVDRAYGRTSGQAILNETTGLTPGTIASQANDASNALTSQVEGQLAGAPDGTLVPARNIAKSFAGTALGRNSAESIKRTGGVVDQLSRQLGPDGKPLMQPIPSLRTKGVGQQPVPIPDIVPASKLLEVKRGIGELQGSWNPAIPNKLGDSSTSAVYHSLDSQMDQLAPGTGELNQRISSLIPVANRAGATDLNEGLIGRTIGRFGKPTGALVGGLAGAAEGRREGGTQGAIIGGLTGLVAPEILSNPTTLMTGARAIYSPITGKLLPAAAGLGLQLDRK